MNFLASHAIFLRDMRDFFLIFSGMLRGMLWNNGLIYLSKSGLLYLSAIDKIRVDIAFGKKKVRLVICRQKNTEQFQN